MKRSGGFTLIEITMVILGVALIAAGIVATRSIIRTSQIQAAMGEFQMYSSAIKNFKNKYMALPGDFSNATDVWGEVSNGCKIGAATGTKTCNGDGDGVIEFNGTDYEHLAAWRHLGLSHFISQNYSGNTFGGGNCAMDIKAGENAPASRLRGGMWNIGSSVAGTPYTTGGGGDQYIPMNLCTNAVTLQVLWLGGGLQDDDGQAAGCSRSQVPVFTGKEAFEIDQKYDNKRAITGKIRAQYNNTALYQSCEDTTNTTNGKYRTDASGINCSLAFIIDP